MHSTIFCGDQICHGGDAYCCLLDSGDEGCCWSFTPPLYGLWWFWLLWIVIFLLILACSASYWRRRWRNRRLAVMANSQYPTYGTVIQTQTRTSRTRGNQVVVPGVVPHPNAPPPPMVYPQGPPSYAAVGPMAPPPPPSYADSEASKNEKPPAYSA